MRYWIRARGVRRTGPAAPRTTRGRSRGAPPAPSRARACLVDRPVISSKAAVDPDDAVRLGAAKHAEGGRQRQHVEIRHRLERSSGEAPGARGAQSPARLRQCSRSQWRQSFRARPTGVGSPWDYRGDCGAILSRIRRSRHLRGPGMTVPDPGPQHHAPSPRPRPDGAARARGRRDRRASGVRGRSDRRAGSARRTDRARPQGPRPPRGSRWAPGTRCGRSPAESPVDRPDPSRAARATRRRCVAPRPHLRAAPRSPGPGSIRRRRGPRRRGSDPPHRSRSPGLHARRQSKSHHPSRPAAPDHAASASGGSSSSRTNLTPRGCRPPCGSPCSRFPRGTPIAASRCRSGRRARG